MNCPTTAALDRPKLARQYPRPVRDEDMAEAIRQAGPSMKAWLTLAAYGGLRCVEIAGLCREDIMEGDDLMLLRGKGGKERIVPLHPLVWRRLRSAGLPRVGPVFVRPCGSPYTAAQVSRTIALWLDELGIDATAHQFRHWFGSRAYQQSGDLRVVQELLGHSSPTTTAVYTACAPGRARVTVESLPLVS